MKVSQCLCVSEKDSAGNQPADVDFDQNCDYANVSYEILR